MRKLYESNYLFPVFPRKLIADDGSMTHGKESLIFELNYLNF